MDMLVYRADQRKEKSLNREIITLSLICAGLGACILWQGVARLNWFSIVFGAVWVIGAIIFPFWSGAFSVVRLPEHHAIIGADEKDVGFVSMKSYKEAVALFVARQNVREDVAVRKRVQDHIVFSLHDADAFI